MQQIVLVGCGSAKQKAGFYKAKDLYTSDYFKQKYEYAESLGFPIYIISALNHLLDVNDMVESYDYTLKGKSKSVKMKWGEKVVSELKEKYPNLDDCNFIILAGNDYSEPLVELLGREHCTLPVEGLPIGKQRSFFKQEIAKKR